MFFFKQKTAYEMRISDWSSDVCSSDLQQTSWPLRWRKVWCRPSLERLPQPFNHLADRRLLDCRRRRALAEFTPNEQRQLCAIGQRLGILLGTKRLQQPVPRIFTKQFLDPVVNRDEMEVDSIKEIGKESCRERV